MRIYVASSWRNQEQPVVVGLLRGLGHEVYDFRHPHHPAPDSPEDGFRWSDIDPNWKSWTTEEYATALKHPIAKRGYKADIEALRACDACVLVLPSGRSASWEFGYAMGEGKKGFVYSSGPCEPELMYSEATIVDSLEDLGSAFRQKWFPKPGDTFRINAPSGSVGIIERMTDYSPYQFYVCFIYGVDVRGEPIRATATTRITEMVPITRESFEAYTRKRAWTKEQKAVVIQDVEHLR